MKGIKIKSLLFNLIILFALIFIMAFNSDTYKNSYSIKYILNGKVKIIINNSTLFYLLILKNNEICGEVGKIDCKTTLKNKDLNLLFEKYSNIFDYSLNDIKYLKNLAISTNFERFINLCQNITLYNFFKKELKKEYNNENKLVYDKEAKQIDFIRFMNELNIFKQKNQKKLDKFYSEIIGIVEKEFNLFFKYISDLKINYFYYISTTNMYYIDFCSFTNVKNEIYRPIIKLYISDNIIDDFYFFLYENNYMHYLMNNYADFIYNKFKKEKDFKKLYSLLIKDKNGKLKYNFKGSIEILQSKEDFYKKFVYDYFNEFFASTFSSFLIYKKFVKLEDIYFYIQGKFIKESKINMNLFNLQSHLIYQNIIYTEFISTIASNEYMYKLFLLFFYTQVYGFEYAKKKISN